MNEAQEFISSMPFIIFFLILTLIISIIGGAKVLYGFLALVLLSMIVLNSDKVATLFQKFKV